MEKDKNQSFTSGNGYISPLIVDNKKKGKKEIVGLVSCQVLTNKVVQSVDASAGAQIVSAGCNNSCQTTCSGSCFGDSGYSEWFHAKYGNITQRQFNEHIEEYFYELCDENNIEICKEKLYCEDGSESSVFYKMVLKKRKTKIFKLRRRSVKIQAVYHPSAEEIYRMFALVVKYFKIDEAVYKSYFDNGNCIEFDTKECLKTIEWFKNMDLSEAIAMACVNQGRVYINPPHA